ncbi:MAG: NAD-dependent DNA ligase LigA, partial [Chlamydiota bacterium]|nr:NAD-dependent DNA ligase LigA [Chlamydiota bacterium]
MASRQNYRQLIAKVRENDQYYFLDDRPQISDHEYDQMLRQIEAIEREHPEWKEGASPTERVGGGASTPSITLPHPVAMLSLANAYSQEEMMAFVDRVNRWVGEEVTYTGELKIDGIAVSLHYERGNLVHGLSRGNGIQGEEITRHILHIPDLPHYVEAFADWEMAIVRGEIFIEQVDFDRMNREREERGEESWANARNAAGGALKLLDSSLSSDRHLKILCYQLITDAPTLPTQKARYGALKEAGFPLHLQELLEGPKDIFHFINRMEGMRRNLPFGVDGVVIKVNEIAHQE